MKIRDFLVEIADEILKDEGYRVRIELDDGGYNSYIGLTVDVIEYEKPIRTSSIRLFRHTNTVDLIKNRWCFILGNICAPYADYPDIPLEFSSYGKTRKEAEKEAQKYLKELRAKIAEITAEYKAERAKNAEAEKERLKARLAELEGHSEDCVCCTPVFRKAKQRPKG